MTSVRSLTSIGSSPSLLFPPVTAITAAAAAGSAGISHPHPSERRLRIKATGRMFGTHSLGRTNAINGCRLLVRPTNGSSSPTIRSPPASCQPADRPGINLFTAAEPPGFSEKYVHGHSITVIRHRSVLSPLLTKS